MIYRLRFCNKDGVEARVEIQKGLATPVVEVEGTERPFVLSYNNDKGNKSGMFLSSSADIEIYETADFNIDNLKTSNETELAVTYYINNVVSWKGFIIPDFFSIEVRNNPVIVMTASDRLGTLKSVTLSDLPAMVNIRELAVSCLNKTGLTLPLKTMADFSNDDTDNAFFSYYIDSQRIKDIKGRSISCYDILSSILIASNSKLVQRDGEWFIMNKLQHEAGSGKVYSSLSTFTNYLESIYNFEEVSVGARRTITPVAGSVGIYHEHGGRKSHPENYDFSLDLSGWNSVNGFTATIENRHITGFLGGTPFFDPDRTVKQYLLNYNNWIDNTNNLNTAPYIATNPIPINSTRADRVEVTIDISSIMAEKLSSFDAISFLRYAVILTNGVKTYTLTKAGIFEILDPENISGHSLLLRGGQQHPLFLASPSFSNSDSFKGLFEVGEDDDINNYSATIRIYGSGDQYVTVNYAIIKFSDVSELPKGTMYKTEQGEVFTKAYDIDTVIFGDYLLSGLDGYFYRYPNDDTSSIYKDVNTLSSPVWTTPNIPNETGELPILHHSMRQMRRMFSVAHDLLSAEIEASNFDPLAIFVACEKRYTVVSAQFDFFKSNLSVELEEVAFQNNTIREYIYSYFGDGETGIKSIGGISAGAGGTGTGGGLTPEQLEILSWWKKDPVNPNTIYTEMNAYSKGELSAYGIGSGGSSGGGVDLLQAWTDYDSAKDNWAVKAGLLVPFYNDTKSRLTSLEGGAALSLSPVGSGNGIANITKSGTVLTVTKANFAELDVNGKILSSQLPSYVDDVLEYVNLTAFPATGETGKIYIAQDTNKTYRWSGTAYTEISASLALGETSSTAYRGDRGKIAYDHSQAEHQTIINGTGFVKANGKTLSYDNNSYSLASHNHSGIYEPVFSKNTAFNKNFGTAAGTVAEGNHTHDDRYKRCYRDQGIDVDANRKENTYLSAYRWINTPVVDIGILETNNQYSNDWVTQEFTQIGQQSRKFIRSFYGGTTWGDWFEFWHSGNLTSLSQLTDNIGVATHIANTSNPHSVTKAQVGLGNVLNVVSYSKTESDTALALKLNKSVFDDLFEKVEISTGVYAIKAKYSFYSTGEVSAYGIGSGGSSGESYERLDKWADYDSTKAGWVLSAFLGNDLNTRVGNLEGGSALTVNTTGTGNAITSISKAGTVITANKDLTFSLAGHTHTISDITNLQTTLNNKLETSIFNTHNNDNVRHITGAERTKWDGVVTDFGNLEIGGRNLTTNFSTWGLSNTSRVLSNNNNTVILSLVNASGSGATTSPNIRRIGRFIVSVNVKTSGPTRIYIDGRGTILKTSHESLRDYVHFTLPSGFDERIVMYYNATVEVNNDWYIGITSDSVTKSVELSYPKLEKGNKATDWTPAPEDQVSDWSITDVNSLSFIKNKPTLLSQFTDNIGVATHIANTSNPHSVTKAQVGLGNVDNTTDSAKNVLSATKLQTARTIWGQSFDGSGNVDGLLTLNHQNIWINSKLQLGRYDTTVYSDKAVIGLTNGNLHIDAYNGYGIYLNYFQGAGGGAGQAVVIRPNGNLGIGTDTDAGYKLDVNGTGRFTGALTAAVSVTTPKVIFAAAGWSVEQSGTEIQFKYNGAIKQRLLSDGTIVGIGEITAFGSTT